MSTIGSSARGASRRTRFVPVSTLSRARFDRRMGGVFICRRRAHDAGARPARPHKSPDAAANWHHQRPGCRRGRFPCGGRVRARDGVEARTSRILREAPCADEPLLHIAKILRRAHALKPIGAAAQLRLEHDELGGIRAVQRANGSQRRGGFHKHAASTIRPSSDIDDRYRGEAPIDLRSNRRRRESASSPCSDVLKRLDRLRPLLPELWSSSSRTRVTIRSIAELSAR